MKSSILMQSLVLVAGASASIFEGLFPVQTSGLEASKIAGFSPKMTEPPSFRPELMKRDYVTSSLSTYINIFAPNATCGYYNGNSATWYTCASTATCDFLPGSSSSYGIQACCNSASCVGRETCIGSSAYYTGTQCGTACASDDATLKCTATGSPYCVGIFFPGVSATGYYCSASSLASFQTFLTTYVGQLPTPIFVTKTYTETITSTVKTSGGTTTTKPTTSPTTAPTTTNTSTTSPVVTGPSATTTSPVQTDTPSSTPVGAIAGGTVGGVAVLAGLAALVFILLRRKRKNAAATNTTTYAPAPQMAQDPAAGYGYSNAGQQPYAADGSNYGGQTAYGGSQMGSPQTGYYNAAPAAAAGAYLSPEQKGFQGQPHIAEADGSTQYGSSPAQTYGSPTQSYAGGHSPAQGTNDMAHPQGQYAAEKSTDPVGGAAEMSGGPPVAAHTPQASPPPPSNVHEMSGFSHQAGPVGEIYEAPGPEHK